ncbi:MAG: diaminopimelate epimerase [Bacteroidia bacterium]|jgi:diaminopimelate epimerase
MANINFFKYQGTGNDFVMIDGMKDAVDVNSLNVPALCDRKFGIGADGVIVLHPLDDFDFNMVYFNSDGTQSFCGNGSRCAVQFAHDQGHIQTNASFLSTDGYHKAEILPDGRIKLEMHDVEYIVFNKDHYVINTGSPHYLQFSDVINLKSIVAEAQTIRYNAGYKTDGINVNFLELGKLQNQLRLRTYERGVEDETLSCGTGVTAAALAYAHHQNLADGNHEILVEAVGGQLSVEFELEGGRYSNIHLIGSAKRVFEGRWSI